MVKNYLKTAWRNLLKHASFSFINILGLAIGIAACMIIFLYVHNELTFDQYNVKAERIARITTTVLSPESNVILATSPAPLADALKREYPEVEATVRITPASVVVTSNNQFFREEAFYKADESIFSIFSFDFTEGDAAGALQHPHSIVITTTIAKKYFGLSPALGKTIICNKENLLITGVVQDRPANSDILIEALLSAEFSTITSWTEDFDMYTFVLFNKKPALKNFEQKANILSEKYIQPEFNAQGATNYKVHFELEPLAAIHFDTGKLADTPKGNKKLSYIFSLLAVFILTIALLNYINLSTARSAERAKEVGIRKVSGAGRFQLICQFLSESFLLVAIACALAVGLSWISLPFLNSLLQTKLVFNRMQELLFVSTIFLITPLLAGLYPAFVLSAFKPVKVLKGSWRHSNKGLLLRKVVIITQFAIAVALIMGTTIIYSQMKFIEKKDLGFNKDQLLSISLPGDTISRNAVNTFQQALRQRPEIRGLTIGNRMTQEGLTLGSTIVETAGKKRELMCNYFQVDPHYLSVFQINLQEGRNLSDSFLTDKKEAFLVNEAFVQTMGWKTAIGKSIEGFGHKGRIIGTVKNFYYKSLHNLIEPLILVYNANPGNNTTTIKIKPRDLPVVQSIYKKNFPALPFDYSFFDEIVNKQYRQDNITMSLFNDFTLLAIFVCCLGLYGLVTLVAVQRAKEISIRKILGATPIQLLSLLAKGFVKLVVVSLVIALPVAGFAMNAWLETYAYHIGLSWWMFVIPIFLILGVTLGVISQEIIKAALTNPVKSLRTE